MNFNYEPPKKYWECFKCDEMYPKTLRYCPICNIAKIHSDNLRESAQKKK